MMSFFSLIRHFTRGNAKPLARQHRPAAAPRKPASFLPSLETLEDRLTPSYGLSTLASFSGASAPGARGVIMDSSGNLYGTTQFEAPRAGN